MDGVGSAEYVGVFLPEPVEHARVGGHGGVDLDPFTADVVALPDVFSGIDSTAADDRDLCRGELLHELRCVGQAEGLHRVTTDAAVPTCLIGLQRWPTIRGVANAVGEGVAGDHRFDNLGAIVTPSCCNHSSNLLEEAGIAVGRELDPDLLLRIEGSDEVQDLVDGLWVEADDLVLCAVITHIGAAEVQLDDTSQMPHVSHELVVLEGVEPRDAQDEALLVALIELRWLITSSWATRSTTVRHAPGVEAEERVVEVLADAIVAVALLPGEGAEHDTVRGTHQLQDPIDVEGLAEPCRADEQGVVGAVFGTGEKHDFVSLSMSMNLLVAVQPGMEYANNTKYC